MGVTSINRCRSSRFICSSGSSLPRMALTFRYKSLKWTMSNVQCFLQGFLLFLIILAGGILQIVADKRDTVLASRARWYTPCYFACWGVSPIPTEHTINCVATLPLGAENHRVGYLCSRGFSFSFSDVSLCKSRSILAFAINTSCISFFTL